MERRRTLQTLPEELFLLLKMYKTGEEYLLLNGIQNVLTPVLICPVTLYGRKKAIGLHIGHDVANFYLFDNPKPHKDKTRCSVLLNAQGGEIEGYLPSDREYVNKLLTPHVKKYVCVVNNHALALSLVWGEIGKMIASHEYFLEESVPKEKVIKLTPFKKSDFKKVVDTYSIAY